MGATLLIPRQSFLQLLEIAQKPRSVVPNLKVPDSKLGQVLVAQDIDDGQPQAYFTNRDYSVFYTRLGEPVDSAKLNHVAIGQQIIVDVTQDGMVAGVWMMDLPPEIREKHMMKQSM